MVLMSIVWLIYYSFIALIRAKIYYFFGAVCVAIVPFYPNKSLTNIIKHSKATETFVQIFERENATIQITIEDDGIGIQNFAESGGIGLKNINKRAKISNLKLTVDSTPAGTNFIIETPTIP